MLNRCSFCSGGSLIPSCGPVPAHCLFIGASPSRDERTEPYQGKAGDELTYTYLQLAGLPRESVHIANGRQCWHGQDKIPSEKSVVGCARTHLPALLDRVKPEVVVLMGGVTQRLSDQRRSLDMYHGRPVRGSLFGGVWEGWIWPMYEPALGMRETPRMAQLTEDFRNLGKWVRGDWEPPSPSPCGKDYRYVNTIGELHQYLDEGGLGATLRLFVDTEKHGPKPFSIQFSHTAHTGRMILADKRPLIEEFNHWVNKDTVPPVIVLHNAPGDLDLMEWKLGMTVRDWSDTMQEAFQQCLPQGLKTLAYRLFGIEMTSWADTVWPSSVNAVCEWMRKGIVLAVNNLRGTERKQLKTKVKFIDKPSATESILSHVLSRTVRTLEEEEPYNPWVHLSEMRSEGLRGRIPEPWEFEWLESELGNLPILGIGNCSPEQALAYAVGDADATGQVATELLRRRGDPCWQVGREDWDCTERQGK